MRYSICFINWNFIEQNWLDYIDIDRIIGSGYRVTQSELCSANIQFHSLIRNQIFDMEILIIKCL